jgi:hypothetical protein
LTWKPETPARTYGHRTESTASSEQKARHWRASWIAPNTQN